jgi:hypothetical protein
VETAARSTSPKLTPLPEAPEHAHELIFTPGEEEAAAALVRRRPPAAPRPTADILAELNRATREPSSESAPVPEIDMADRDERIGEILAEMLADAEASFRSDAVLYQDFLVRCRIRRLPGQPPALPEFRRMLAVARAGVDTETAEGEEWQQALVLSRDLPEDVQGVFLSVAQAAVAGRPCPSDLTLARIYGTHSARRARRLLTYFEERGLVVLRTDFSGKRAVAFPDLGCETLGGDPNGPDTLQEERSAAE